MVKIYMDEKTIETLIDQITNIELPGFSIVGMHIHNLRVGELKHSQELISEVIKYSKIDKDKQKCLITIDLELQEK